MTLLTVAQRVADEVGLPRPSAVATGTDQLSRQMFALANAVLEELGEINWPVLEIPYQFNTVAGQSQYALPNDFDREVSDTAYLSTLYYELRGSLTPAEWHRRRSGLPSYTGRYRYRTFGNPLKINITPVPQTVETVTLEYVTTNYAKDTNGVAIPLYSADNDVSLMPEELVRMGLKWRIKHAKGLDYSEDYNKYERTRKTLFAQQLNLGSVPVAQRTLADTPELGGGYVPEVGYGD